MHKIALRDGAESFELTVLEADAPRRIVLFAVGAGGNPERHLPLLNSLAEHGCHVVAPHFERLVSPIPTASDLLLRARRLGLALDSVARPGLLVAGLGHSIGATLLLALAAGQLWTRAGEHVRIDRDERIERLALLNPATGFFQVPGTLDAVRTPILAWAGALDVVTPPADVEFLKQALGQRVPLQVRVVEAAGHFSFMHVPPPHAVETLPDRVTVLADLTAEVCRFIAG